MYFALRFEGDGAGLAQALRGAIAALDGSVALADVKTMDQRMGVAVSRERFSTLLLSLFAGLALALAMLGVYAVMAYSVAQRTREIDPSLARDRAHAAWAARVRHLHRRVQGVSEAVRGLHGQRGPQRRKSSPTSPSPPPSWRAPSS